MILHISVQFRCHVATWFVALGRHRGFLASSDLICWSRLGKKVNIEQQIEDGMSSRKVSTVFQCFSLGPLSFWQAFSNFLAIYRISGCMGITRGKTNIHRKHLLPKILHIPHPPLSPHHCVSPSWSLKVCVDWRGWTSKLEEAEVTSTMSLQGLVTS